MLERKQLGPWLIGVDLDHTLISYDVALKRWAAQFGVIVSMGASLKDAVRAHCRRSPDGDLAWQRVQADIYGHAIAEALPTQGALSFLAWAKRAGLHVVVVSHKSEFAAAAPTGPDLREAALSWMNAHGFFHPDTGLTEAQVYFEPARDEKVARIAALGCSHFIDDLPEVFIEPGFPRGTVPILFAPEGAGEGNWQVSRSWRDVEVFISTALLHEYWTSRELRLEMNLGEKGISLTRLHGGRNSRVYRMEAAGRIDGVVKMYADQSRARNEFEALAFLEQLGVSGVPRARSIDALEGVAFYDYIQGTPFREEIVDADLDAAIALISAINVPHPLRDTWQRPASEAMLNREAMCTNLRLRMAPLIQATEDTPMHRAMKTFVGGTLNECIGHLEVLVKAEKPPFGQQRVLSPSDFGFHNALRCDDGGLAFVDFEYFGWDDPAKLLSDFLWHPAMNLSDAHKQRFTRGVLGLVESAELLARGLPLAYALCGVKWCTILLNEFLPKHWARRAFAGEMRPREEVLAEQLEKARSYAARVEFLDGKFPHELHA